MRNILTLILTLALVAVSNAQEPQEANSTCIIAALNADGHYISMSSLNYYPAEEGADDFAAAYGWSTFGCGEPLDLILDCPLSHDSYDPLNPGSCGEGVDPAAIAALKSCNVLVRHGFCTMPCPDPAHPSGEFYSTELPSGGLVILRLPQGIHPHEMFAEWRDEHYPLKYLDFKDAARLMTAGEPNPNRPEGGLETAVARVDCATVVAFAEEDVYSRQELLFEAAGVVDRCIRKYHERHGEYPAELCELTTVPGAVVARLPYNPYHAGHQLGSEEVLKLREGICYYPDRGAEFEGDIATITGYWLAVTGSGESVDPAVPFNGAYTPNGLISGWTPVKWFEQH